MFEGLLQPIHLLLIVCIAFVLLVPFWRIFKKCGFSPWLSVLMLIPFLGLATHRRRPNQHASRGVCDQPHPSLAGAFGDRAGAMNLAFGIASALYQRFFDSVYVLCKLEMRRACALGRT